MTTELATEPLVSTGLAIYCDDVREEAGGKLSYMGIYRGVLILPAPPPTLLPKFFVVVMFNYPASEPDEPVVVRLYFPGNEDDGEPSAVIELPPSERKEQPGWMTDAKPENLLRSIALPIGFGALQIEKLGKFRVRLTKGDKTYRLSGLEVVVANGAASSSTENDGEPS